MIAPVRGIDRLWPHRAAGDWALVGGIVARDVCRFKHVRVEAVGGSHHSPAGEGPGCSIAARPSYGMESGDENDAVSAKSNDGVHFSRFATSKKTTTQRLWV